MSVMQSMAMQAQEGTRAVTDQCPAYAPSEGFGEYTHASAPAQTYVPRWAPPVLGFPPVPNFFGTTGIRPTPIPPRSDIVNARQKTLPELHHRPQTTPVVKHLHSKLQKKHHLVNSTCTRYFQTHYILSFA